jgi:hypothetical protein
LRTATKKIITQHHYPTLPTVRLVAVVAPAVGARDQQRPVPAAMRCGGSGGKEGRVRGHAGHGAWGTSNRTGGAMRPVRRRVARESTAYRQVSSCGGLQPARVGVVGPTPSKRMRACRDYACHACMSRCDACVRRGFPPTPVTHWPGPAASPTGPGGHCRSLLRTFGRWSPHQGIPRLRASRRPCPAPARARAALGLRGGSGGGRVGICQP